MILTNKLGLPSTIVRAVANDSYVGGGDISVTKLISPPYQNKLRKDHADEVTEDVADRIWALMGQIGHAILERVDTDEETAVREERLYTTVIGPVAEWSVSGQFDLIEKGVLMDFKFTSVYAARRSKSEWEEQLNLLRYLCHVHRLKTLDDRYWVKSLQIIAVLRDWKKRETTQQNYPPHQIMVIPIEMWDLDRTHRFLMQRVALHQSAHPTPCTDEERWKSEDVFALMKKGRKTAVKLYQTKDGADTALRDAGKDHFVTYRPGSYLRCENYCSVSSVCPTWQENLRAEPF